MPWKVIKRDCDQKSTGKKGSHVVVKVKDDNSTEQESCHTSDEKAQGAMRARYASKNEGAVKTMKITKRQLRRIIREGLLSERVGPMLAGAESQLRYSLVEFIQSYMMSMAMNPGDPSDRNRVRAHIDEMVTAILGD